MDRPPELGDLTGWRLSLGAAGAFVLPLVLALVGSLVVSDRWQWAGALVGLLTGLIGAWCVVALLRRSTRRGHGDSNS